MQNKGVNHVPPLKQLERLSSVVLIPLRAEFREIWYRQVMLFEGDSGFGEWAAFPGYSDEVSSRWLATALEQAFGPKPVLPRELTKPVPVNAIFPAVPSSQFAIWWRNFPGVKTAKMKVAESGRSINHDVERISALRDAVGEQVKIRLDANGRWSVDEAAEVLTRVSPLSIDFVEQPVATVSEMVELSRRISGLGIRVAADELVRDMRGLKEIISSDVADVAVLKVSPIGGIKATQHMARTAHKAGLEIVLSSALESSIGISWGIRAATLIRDELGDLPDAGFGTSVLLKEDIVQNPVHIHRGAVSVEDPEVDTRKIGELSAPRETCRWWRNRLRRCLPLAIQILESQKR